MRERVPKVTDTHDGNVYYFEQFRVQHRPNEPVSEHPNAKKALASVSLLRISDQRFIADAKSSTPRYHADLEPKTDEKLGEYLYRGYAENTSSIRRDEELNYLQHLGANLLANSVGWGETKKALSASKQHLTPASPAPEHPQKITVKKTKADHLFVVEDANRLHNNKTVY